MNQFNPKRVLMAAAAALALAGAAQATDISGAGATFPYPIYSKWADAYKQQTGVGLNYQSIGSGGGIKQIKAKTVTFGASDMPLKPEELKETGLVQFPMIIGGVVPVVHVKGVGPGQMLLDGATVAAIYLGEITQWNDARIKKLNPKLALPDTAIAPVYRSDGSGTNFLFSDYLSKSSPKFKESIGANTSVQWPSGIGAKGNEGVANMTTQTDGAIGYVEYAYAKQNKMAYAQLKNHDEQRGLEERARLLPDPHQPGRRQELADHRRQLHPGVRHASGSGGDGRGTEVLRLGVQERRQDGGRA
jgi:phosphate transport system substrate-binding protein